MLLQLMSKTTSASVKDFEFDKLLDRLTSEGFVGVLFSLREQAAKLLGAPFAAVTPRAADSSAGDLSFTADNRLHFIKCRWEAVADPAADPFADPGRLGLASKLTLEVGEIAPVGAADADGLARLCSDVATILEVEWNTPPLTWEDAVAPAEPLADLGGKAVEPPTPADLELAAILREKKLEPFLAAMLEKRHELILDQWLADRPDAQEVEYFIDKLFEADFFEEEIVVYSRQTNQPVIRAKDRAGLEALKAAGVRDVNGEDLDTENVRRLLILPKDKRAYLTKGWAARATLLDLLVKLGVRRDEVREFDPVGGLQLLAAMYDGKPLLFVFGKKELDPKDFVSLSSTLKKLGGPTVVAVAKKDTDADAAVAAGASECLALGGIEEYNTTLLDYLAGKRNQRIAAALAEFDDMLHINVSSMALGRFASL
jgi:hypothetical protein